MIQELMNSPNFILAAKDKNLKYLYCNEKLAEYMQADSPNQVVKKSDRVFFSDKFSSIYELGDYRVLNGEILLNELEIMPNPDQPNQLIKLLTSKNVLKDKHGKPKGIVISCLDVTDVGYITNINNTVGNWRKKHFSMVIDNNTVEFTKREYQTLKQIMLGKTNHQIASNLSISPRTIENFVDNIKSKLQCHSKFAIIETVMRLGLSHQLLES